jgi:hypothetical protein
MGEDKRGAGDCGGAKRTVPRVVPGFGKTEVRQELRPGVRKRLLPVHLGMLDGSFEVAGTAYMQCEDNFKIGMLDSLVVALTVGQNSHFRVRTERLLEKS